MNNTRALSLPVFLATLIALCAILYFGKHFLIPLAFGALLAMIFYPLMLKFRRWRLPDWTGIVASLLILFVIASIFTLIIVFQTQSLIEDWPEIRQELEQRQDQVEDFMINNLGIASEERVQQFKDRLGQQTSQIQQLLSSFFGSFFTIVTGLALSIIYLVIFLWEEKRLMRFLVKINSERAPEQTREMVNGCRNIAAQYLTGRLILVGVLGIFYSLGFYLFGLNYAIPIAILVALLSLIPYLGNIIGGAIAILIALATGNGIHTILGVLGTMAGMQVLENNVLTPWILGERMALNTLATIIGVIGFSFLWGIAGTVLAIPMLGVVKTAFAFYPASQPYAHLLGTEATDAAEERGAEEEA